jgi:hypothetical protein
MHCLMLPSSQRWFCALSGSARGRISEFRDAHKGRYDARTSKKRIVSAVNGQARRDWPGEPVRASMWQPLICGVPNEARQSSAQDQTPSINPSQQTRNSS